MSDEKQTVLVLGDLNAHAVEEIGSRFFLRRIERGEVALVTQELARDVSAIAAMSALAPVDAALIDALPGLEIIANFGVGYDGVDARHAADRGVMVTNTPDVLTEEVADTAIALLLNTVREYSRAESWLRDGMWGKQGQYPLTATSLRGRRVGIFGLGRIGRAVARRLEGFDVPISYHNRRPVEGVSYSYHASLLELAQAVDTLICVAPGGAATERAIEADVLRALGPDGVLINIGRGSTVDEEALVEALEDGTIRAAGLDVFADEPNVPERLLRLPNACLLPHVGSSSQRTRDAMGDVVVANLVSWFSDGKALTPVAETLRVKRR